MGYPVWYNNKKMEIFLSKEASKAISALQTCQVNTNTDGFLIGHTRGNMYFVEKIFPSPKGFFSTLEELFIAKKKLEDKILGFYSFHTTEGKLKKILSPAAFGKIYLRIDRNKKNMWELSPFVIEHDKDFYLLPVGLKSSK
jgi:hypothetical protein